MEIKDIARIAKEKNIDFFFAQYVNMYGVANAKLVPANHLEDMFTDGACFAGFAAVGFSVGPDAPDLAAIPDPNTLTILPWKKNIARFACNVYEEDENGNRNQSLFCSRSILQRVTAKAREKGYQLKIGIEPEFFLVERSADGIKPADDWDTLAKPCYDLKGLTRRIGFLETAINYMNEMGWDVYATDHEDANSQYEINFDFSDCVDLCDRYVFLRYMLATLAQQENLIATFMPKPFANRTGNGAHFHMSLWDVNTGKNVFLDENDPNGKGLSQLGYNFIGGLLKHAKAYIAFSAPSVNSYKRLIAGGAMGGSTWAPVYVSYGGNNRSQMIRIPGAGRMEDRTVDSACNPYLAAAAMLTAGLDGIENKIDPGPRNDTDMYQWTAEDLKKAGIELLPSNLKEAMDELAKDEVILEGMGREFCNYYMDFKKKEWNEYHDTVSNWELDKYLTLF
ncbi:type III glutamate--ammonia ligase [Chloroflexota bacterium]